jgi:hypothetical protein
MFKPLRFAVLLAGVTLAFSAFAQQPPPDEDGAGGPVADPPTRVARLSYLHGDVSFVPAGENDWVEAVANRPLITGDKLWTDRGSRAELGIGPATLRIDQNTSFDFLNLDDKVAQVELTQGSLSLHLRRLYDEQSYEVDTPTLAFVINRVGEYRVDVLPNGQSTVVTVLHGGGDAYGEGGARFRIEEGQSVTFNDPQLQNYESADVPRPDDFDNFANERDHRWDNSGSRRFVSEEVIGYEDLDDNGAWSDVPEYGNVWYPSTVAAGWSPYHNGHWGWVGAYGWTWIDDAPWGFAPFHYGRWAYINNRWGWCPGPVAVRAVYAPALVAFVGGGVGVGFGNGPVGWFPLGPRDVYYPGYRVSEHYFVNLNFSNSRHFDRVTINNYYGNYSRGHVDYEHINYANRNVVGAVVAVPHAAFIGARPVSREAIVVNHETFANGGRVAGFAAVAPTRTSLVASNGPAHFAPPAGLANRQVVAASRPPAPTASFAQRETQLQRNPGQPLAATQLRAPVAAAGPAGSANAGRQNFRVVTNNGAPVRTAAPALPARPVTAGPNAGNTRVAPGGVNGRENPTVQNGRGNLPAVQSNNNAVNGRESQNGRGNLPAVQNNNNAVTNNGRPAAGGHVDSSRFAHPQNGGPATSPNSSVGQATHATATPQAVQRTNTLPNNTGTPNNNNRGGADRTAQNPTAGRAPVQATQQPQTLKPVATPASPKPLTSPYGGGDRGGNGNANQYRQAQQQQQQSHTPQPQVQHATPPQPQAQQYHAPTPQPQQQNRAPTNVQQQGQMMQQHQPPAQVQRAPPAANSRASAPQGKEKDKKDDDKHH